MRWGFFVFFYKMQHYFFKGMTVLLLHKFNCESLSPLAFYDYVFISAKTQMYIKKIAIVFDRDFVYIL